MIRLCKPCEVSFAIKHYTSQLTGQHFSKSLKINSILRHGDRRLIADGKNEMGNTSLKKIREGFGKFMAKRGRLVKLVTALAALVFLSGILSGFMLAAVKSSNQTSSTLSNVGTVKAVGIGVYWDTALTNRTTTINWGTLDPGTQRSFTLFMQNEGNSAITLSLSTSNWNPSTASTYMTLTWNYNNQPINAGATTQVTLTLTVSPTATGITSFSFDTIIVGSG